MESHAIPQQLSGKEFKYQIIIVASYKELRLLAKRIDIDYSFLQMKFIPSIASDTNCFDIYIADPDNCENKIAQKFPLAHAFIYLNYNKKLRQKFQPYQNKSCVELFFNIFEENSSMQLLVDTLDTVADAHQNKSKFDVNFKLKVLFILQDTDKNSLLLFLDKDILQLIALKYNQVARQKSSFFFPEKQITAGNNILADEDVEKSSDCCRCILI